MLSLPPLLGTQVGSYLKRLTCGGKSQQHILYTPIYARQSVDEESSQESKPKNEKGFKGHGMLAPFTAPLQTAMVEPFVIEKSKGCYVYDNNGNKFLDGISGAFCTSLGGDEPRLIAAANDQLNTLPFYPVFWNCVTRPSLDLANELLDLFTARKMEKVFFTNGGSDANDTQVKLVWYYNNALGRPKKKKIISSKKSYHGATVISTSISGLTDLHEGFDLPAPFVLQIEEPHYWHHHLPGETEEHFTARVVNDLENLILREGPETVAAFISEPVKAAGGVIIPPENYYEKVQAVLKKYDIIFIADEIVCGFGRLGSMFGCDKFNIKPDLVSLAKGLSSAYIPIGAVLISPEITEVIDTQSNNLGSFFHGFTYSGHPVACAVALEAIKIYKDRKIHEQVQKISPRFLDGMRSFSDSPIIGEIRGIGLLLALEFTDKKSPNDLFPSEWEIGKYFQAECKNRGLLARVIDNDNIVFLAPPLIISSEEIDQIIGICGEALKATEERVMKLKMQHQ